MSEPITVLKPEKTENTPQIANEPTLPIEYFDNPYEYANSMATVANVGLPENWEDESLSVNADFDSTFAEKIKAKETQERLEQIKTELSQEQDSEQELAKAELIKKEIAEQFLAFSEFEGFENWYGGELSVLFADLYEIFDKDKWGDEDKKILIETFKKTISHIKTIGNSVINKKFHENLGKNLVGFHNALARLFNFIIADPDNRPFLLTNTDNSLKFVKTNNYENPIEDIQPEEWEQINNFIRNCLCKEYDSLEETYEDIQSQINEYEKNQRATKNAEKIFESTEDNQDLINVLIHQGLISEGDWQYNKKNICSLDKLLELKRTIANTQALVAGISKQILKDKVEVALSTEGFVDENGSMNSVLNIFKNAKNIYKERKKNIENLDVQKFMLKKDLIPILDNAIVQINDFIAKNKDTLSDISAHLNKPGSDIELEALLPLINRIDEIVCPVVNSVSTLYAIQAFKNYENFEQESKNIAPHTMTNLIKTLINYLHDPKSVGLSNEMFKNKAEMSEAALYAYNKNKKDKENMKNKAAEHKNTYIASLSTMMAHLNDTENMQLEEQMATLENKSKGTDYENIAEEFLSDESKSSSFRRDNDDEDNDYNKKQENEFQEECKNLQTILRLAGIIAKQYGGKNGYNLERFLYNDKSKALDVFKKLVQTTTGDNRRQYKKYILDELNKFAKEILPEKHKADKSKLQKQTDTAQTDKSKIQSQKPKSPLPDIITEFAEDLKSYFKNEYPPVSLPYTTRDLIDHISDSSKLNTESDKQFFSSINHMRIDL